MKRAAWQEKAMREAIRSRERAELERLRLELKHAKEKRRQVTQHARALCKRSRTALALKLKERRRVERERLKLEAKRARESERGACKARKAIAKRLSSAEVLKSAAGLAEARAMQQRLHAQARRKVVSGVPRSARIHESDDQATRDIPPELQRTWLKVKHRFPSGGRRSRAEAFLHWAHENPDELVEIAQIQADREVARLVEEHKAHSRKMGTRKTKAQIAVELAAVPF